MGRVVSLRLTDVQVERLKRAGNQFGKSPAQVAARLLEERLRQLEYPLIEFRDTPTGRRAYLRGTRIAIWHVAAPTREYGGDASETAAYLEVPEAEVKAALAYIDAYPDEIEEAIAENDWVVEHALPSTPGFEAVAVDAAAP